MREIPPPIIWALLKNQPDYNKTCKILCKDFPGQNPEPGPGGAEAHGSWIFGMWGTLTGPPSAPQGGTLEPRGSPEGKRSSRGARQDIAEAGVSQFQAFKIGEIRL